MDMTILCSVVLDDQVGTFRHNWIKTILSQHSFNISQKLDVLVSPLICVLSSASNHFTDILDRSEFISNARSARDTISFKACHSLLSLEALSGCLREITVSRMQLVRKRERLGVFYYVERQRLS
jgi:hypothetical protein